MNCWGLLRAFTSTGFDQHVLPAKRLGSPGKWFGSSETSKQDSKAPQ